ncbi:hypothetical protein [Streptomyces acidicola]|uniref:hypothetical protein n=1 Tax=Streptomyces acidicola TaxID=2596892 RepID=UPI00382B1F66
MLSRLATYTARTDSGEVAARAAAIWRAALDAGLPAAALHGAGHFAFADSLDEGTWLELTATTLASNPTWKTPTTSPNAPPAPPRRLPPR